MFFQVAQSFRVSIETISTVLCLSLAFVEINVSSSPFNGVLLLLFMLRDLCLEMFHSAVINHCKLFIFVIELLLNVLCEFHAHF